jgi:hypothetical protein
MVFGFMVFLEERRMAKCCSKDAAKKVAKKPAAKKAPAKKATKKK